MVAASKDTFLLAEIINKRINTNHIKKNVNTEITNDTSVNVDKKINIKNKIGITTRKLRYKKKDLYIAREFTP